MSTDFYRPVEPVTRLEVSDVPSSDVPSDIPSQTGKKVAVWVTGKLAGVLYMSASDAKKLAFRLSRDVFVAHRFAARSPNRSALRIEDNSMTLDDTLISGSGDVTTLREVMETVDSVLRWPELKQA